MASPPCKAEPCWEMGTPLSITAPRSDRDRPRLPDTDTRTRGGEGRWERVNGDTEGGTRGWDGAGKPEPRGEQDFTFVGVCIAKGQHAPCEQRQGLATPARGSAGTRRGDALLPKPTCTEPGS